MKKLNKLQIEPGKLMKEEELLILRGGYGICTCECHHGDNFTPLGYLVTEGDNCSDACVYLWEGIYERYDVGGSPASSGCW